MGGLTRPCRRQEADRDEADLEPSHEDVKSESSESGRLGFLEIFFGIRIDIKSEQRIAALRIKLCKFGFGKEHCNTQPGGKEL